MEEVEKTFIFLPVQEKTADKRRDTELVCSDDKCGDHDTEPVERCLSGKTLPKTAK
jgi:hypothetical protein